MYKTIVLVVCMALLLAACSSPTADPAQSPPAAATDTPQAMPPTEVVDATQPPTPAGESLVVYRIVPGESELKYEVGETFLDQNNRFNLAVGTTPQVAGEVRVDKTAPQNSSLGIITADISQFTSDSSRRDGALRNRFLESARYPIVTFTPQNIEGLPASYTEGEELSFKVSGDLTIREVTRPVAFEVKARLNGDMLSGEAVTTILMSEFGFGPISIAGILNTEDEVKVTLTFVARP